MAELFHHFAGYISSQLLCQAETSCLSVNILVGLLVCVVSELEIVSFSLFALTCLVSLFSSFSLDGKRS